MYLNRDAFESTLRFIATLPAGSAVIFDYAISPASHDGFQRAVFDTMADRVSAAGEPWKRYCSGRADPLRVGSLARLMVAQR
jgi:O-methyltransferase involved in polyketide biosynthesis